MNERYLIVGNSVVDTTTHEVFRTINEAAVRHLHHRLMMLEAKRFVMLEMNRLAIQIKEEENEAK